MARSSRQEHPAPCALVVSYAKQQPGEAVSARFVREMPNVGSAGEFHAASTSAPRIQFGVPALEHRTIPLEALANSYEAKLVLDGRTRPGQRQHVGDPLPREPLSRLSYLRLGTRTGPSDPSAA